MSGKVCLVGLKTRSFTPFPLSCLPQLLCPNGSMTEAGMLSEDMGCGSCQAGSWHRDRPIRAARELQEARTDPGILLPPRDRQHMDEAGSSELQIAAARANAVMKETQTRSALHLQPLLLCWSCSVPLGARVLLQIKWKPKDCSKSNAES